MHMDAYAVLSQGISVQSIEREKDRTVQVQDIIEIYRVQDEVRYIWSCYKYKKYIRTRLRALSTEMIPVSWQSTSK